MHIAIKVETHFKAIVCYSIASLPLLQNNTVSPVNLMVVNLNDKMHVKVNAD